MKVIHCGAQIERIFIPLVLDEAERYKVYLRYGYNSLFQYAVQALGLSEGVAYNFINVGRAAREIPELKAEIASGALSVSKARSFTSQSARVGSRPNELCAGAK
jgi:hypothetical protein